MDTIPFSAADFQKVPQTIPFGNSSGFPTEAPPSVVHAFNAKLNPQAQQNLANITKGTSTSVAANFIPSLPEAATQAILGTPARFIASVAEVPKILSTGQATNKTYNIPFLQPFQSIQSQESQRMEQGMNPVKAAMLAGVNVVGSGIATAGLADSAKLGLTEAKTGLTNLSEKAIANNSTKAESKAIDNIQEIISPKITSKETQAIINEGRLTRGNESLLFGKQPDIVTQSDAIKQAAKIINDTIPDAAKMNDAELVTSLKNNIGEISQTLQPEMETTPVKPETIQKVQDVWRTLKSEQQARPEFLDNKAGNMAFQNKFENYLNQIESATNMDEVWQTRWAYDDSVPANVKNATSASPPQFQVRKIMWQENRAIPNSAINDTANGLGQTSQKAFSDMSHMYEAKENILSKAKIDVKGKPGPLSGSTLKKTAIVGGSAIVVEKALKGLGIPFLP